MNAHLDFLVSVVYDHGALMPKHLADLRKSGLADATIQAHKFRSVPPDMLRHLLGFDIPTVQSAMLIPFPDPVAGFMDHVRVKVFPPFTSTRGGTKKYLQLRRSGFRLF